MVFRGPQRTCAARKAGWAEMAVCGTRSAAAAEVVVVGASGAGRAKAEGARPGRRIGREVKVLQRFLLGNGVVQEERADRMYLAERRMGVRVVDARAGRAVAATRRVKGWRSIFGWGGPRGRAREGRRETWRAFCLAMGEFPCWAVFEVERRLKESRAGEILQTMSRVAGAGSCGSTMIAPARH